MGQIYILTNKAFPDLVKIGYATDYKDRLKKLNSSDAAPYAFSCYAIYEVDTKLSDLQVHQIIDTLNPNLRTKDEVDGKIRVREYFKMSKEDAYLMFKAMAEIHGTLDRLKLVGDDAQHICHKENESIRTEYGIDIIDKKVYTLNDNDLDLTSKKFKEIIINGKHIQVNSGKDLLIGFLKELFIINENMLVNLAESSFSMNPKSKPYISYDKTVMTSPYKFNSQIFIETCLSNEQKKRFMLLLATKFDIEPSKIIIEIQ